MYTAFHPPYFHFTAVAAVILLVSFYFFATKSMSAYRQLRLKWNPPAPYDPRLLRFDLNAAMFRSIFVILGILLLLFAVYLTRYDLIGDKASPGGEAEFRKGTVEFHGMNGESWSVPVQGSKAAVAGIILRFPAWLRPAGLGNYHKVIGFRGFDENQYHYVPPPPDWIQSKADALFVFFYKNREWLKIPSAVYVESPYFSPGPHQIFVTHSGYIVD